MKRILTNYDDVSYDNELYSYDQNWIRHICKLPSFIQGNYQLYMDVWFKNMDVLFPVESMTDETAAYYVENGSRMNLLICKNDRAVLGVKFYEDEEERALHMQICTSYLKSFPVMQFPWSAYFGNATYVPIILEMIEKKLATDILYPAKAKILFRTFPIDTSGTEAIAYAKAHLLTQSVTTTSPPKYVYRPSQYGCEYGIVASYCAKSKYPEIRTTKNGKAELARSLSYQNRRIDIEKEIPKEISKS
ncbi:hypothetical protein [Roseburia sp. 499]|uniref:hypothetical protein n=1 Tax=Roseburia sp. 499 TaxID=1261634 RepID=UPI000950EC8C|nr:hypothetical protein [Roseburia sp. 499]WVK69423.1 hypothetical protein BIV20_13825 [Roseburia sp. 499]